MEQRWKTAQVTHPIAQGRDRVDDLGGEIHWSGGVFGDVLFVCDCSPEKTATRGPGQGFGMIGRCSCMCWPLRRAWVGAGRGGGDGAQGMGVTKDAPCRACWGIAAMYARVCCLGHTIFMAQIWCIRVVGSSPTSGRARAKGLEMELLEESRMDVVESKGAQGWNSPLAHNSTDTHSRSRSSRSSSSESLPRGHPTGPTSAWRPRPPGRRPLPCRGHSPPPHTPS